MRIVKEKIAIDQEETRNFFKRRAKKFKEDNPYSVTMYQDNNKELVIQRNTKEINKLRPLLNIGEQSRVLDIACGIGRWADALPPDIAEYCGIDFSEEFIAIANQRNTKKNFEFYTGSVDEVQNVLAAHHKGKYNTILIMGIMVYLNDENLFPLLQQVKHVCEDNTIICIREPIALKDKLTLKDFFSDELEDNYNAIYRTREELIKILQQTLFLDGFTIREEGFLYDDEFLNNRKETTQYYFILSSRNSEPVGHSPLADEL